MSSKEIEGAIAEIRGHIIDLLDTLRDLVALAEDLPVDSKAQKVQRFITQLLEEQPDEKLLLFTEYRDTLDYLLEFVQDEPWADEIRPPGADASFGPFTFDRDFAMEHEDVTYLAPDTDVLPQLMACVLNDERGEVGLKLLLFVDTPGITYNYRVAFEDGTGEVIREETIPVFVDAGHGTPNRRSVSG